MKHLAGRRVLLGISGGIAAYKSAELTRHLKKAGADVRVVMTHGAQAFITPMTLQALSGQAVHTDLLDPNAEAAMGHIELARWAECIVIAPTTAEFLSKLATGSAGDLLSTLCLASEAPLILAPAMNQAMWRNPITQHNTQHLSQCYQQRLTWLGPDAGVQACGDNGPGRMLEPLAIAQAINQHFIKAADVVAQTNTSSTQLNGLHITITAGPTREAIDPVRYISNHSSGKMGYALAEAAQGLGATVTLISGPVNLAPPNHVQLVKVESALDLLAAAEAHSSCDIFIGTAAVADYRIETISSQKIKKSGEKLQLSLVQNPDIIHHISHLTPSPFMVGFAAETQDVIKYAQQKLVKKKLDLIVANDVSRADIGFNSNENAATLCWKNGHCSFEKMSKRELANQLLEHIASHYRKKNPIHSTQGQS